MKRSVFLTNGNDVKGILPLGEDKVVSFSVDDQGKLRLYELGQERATAKRVLHAHEADVTGLALLPDQLGFVSASEDSTLMIWDPKDNTWAEGKPKSVIRAHETRITSVCVVGDKLVSAAPEEPLRVWSAVDGKPCTDVEMPTVRSVYTMCANTDGKTLFYLADNEESELVIFSLDLTSGSESLSQFSSEPYSNGGLSVTPDGKYLLSGTWVEGGYHVLGVWDLERQEYIYSFRNLDGECNMVAVSPDSRWGFALANWQLSIWSLVDFEKARGTITDYSAECFALTQAGDKLWLGHSDGKIQCQAFKDGELTEISL